MAHKVAQVTPSLRCKKGGLQQKMCHNALKTERGKKYEISFAREARVFAFHTYTFFKGTYISFKAAIAAIFAGVSKMCILTHPPLCWGGLTAKLVP